jgi:hypothetical protein
MKYLSLILLLSLQIKLIAQIKTPINGVPDSRNTTYAITGVYVHKNANETISDGVLILRNGKILDVGKNIVIPNDAVVISLPGKHVYPAFIEISSNYGLSNPKEITKNTNTVERPDQGAFSWNMAIHPEYRAVDNFLTKPSDAANYRKMGFGYVCTHNKDGIMRGTGAVVSLAEKPVTESVIKSDAIT